MPPDCKELERVYDHPGPGDVPESEDDDGIYDDLQMR